MGYSKKQHNYWNWALMVCILWNNWRNPDLHIIAWLRVRISDNFRALEKKKESEIIEPSLPQIFNFCKILWRGKKDVWLDRFRKYLTIQADSCNSPVIVMALRRLTVKSKAKLSLPYTPLTYLSLIWYSANSFHFYFLKINAYHNQCLWEDNSRNDKETESQLLKQKTEA